ncbi:uncharacterized protein J4E88_009599 [Alternaria novae-zelandiae]|uniref:uncharacterized protein n=1 Tax=Alternaria novae-zelandiae TaxID=430562 RepID=UPI0020C2A72F|nr:uncharacterized protein J4E88_009599 [Alternaria novae-zelandiae]KAI4670847.1 hypothetical protein J4E88_009599 [Alternaria novae-zelandiae]
MDLDEFWMSFLGEAAESELQFPRSETFSDTRTRRIIQLYFTEKRPLSEVRTLIEQEFGFIATVRQYRSRLTRWKLDKNVKPEEMKAIVRLRQQRSLVESDKRDLKFRVRGQEVEPQNIESSAVSAMDLIKTSKM